jgi:hypothetical protein
MTTKLWRTTARKMLRVTESLAAVGMFAGVCAGPALATVPSPPPNHIMNRSTRLCLDSNIAGKVYMLQCMPKDLYQQWAWSMTSWR